MRSATLIPAMVALSSRRRLAAVLLVAAIAPGCNGARARNPEAAPPPQAREPSGPEIPAERKATWLRISPRNTDVAPGASIKFELAGYDNHDREVTVAPGWAATRGTIGPGGEFVAPLKKGVAVVTAEDAISGLKAFAVVHVDPDPRPTAQSEKPREPEKPRGSETDPAVPGIAEKPPVGTEKTGPKPGESPPAAMTITAWRVSGKGRRYRLECAAVCRAKAARWVKLFAVSRDGRMSLLQSRFAKRGVASVFNAPFSLAEVRWLEVRLYDAGGRVLARERRRAR